VPFIGARIGKILRIHYHEFNEPVERLNTLITAMFDEKENLEGELYVL
jgi:hypothetical protein